VQRARGYDYTIVAGEVFMDHGEHTGACSGALLTGAAHRRRR
jgi:N-acyl-D-aspartate/D-glutamate deacylase